MPSRSRCALSLRGKGNDPLSTAFVIEDRLVFEVCTNKVNPPRTTSIRTGKGVATAEILWTIQPEETRVTFHGVGMALNEFLREDICLNTSRNFKCTNGRRYKWKEQLGKDNLMLIDATSRKRIAESHGFRTLGIDVFSGGRDLMDAIIVTYLIMEKLKRERRECDRALDKKRGSPGVRDT